MLRDLRCALRQLLKSVGFTFIAVLTLALGIGANTAIYSIIHAALRLPYPHSERMMGIQNVFPQGSYYAASYPDFLAWRAKATSFSQLVASFSTRATWNGADFGAAVPEAINTGLASEGFFVLFGMKPVAGRDFTSSEHQLGSVPVCIVAENFWRTQLRADPGVVGKSLDLDAKACTIVGVMPVFVPEVFRPTQIWLPLETNKPWDQHGTNYLFVRGMLRPGVTQQQALAELSTIQSQIDKQFPDNKHAVAVHPLSQAYFGDLRSIMFVLLAAVGLILLIACVNLANMLLARASDRAREFAVRRALGASAARLMRQSLTESLLLALAGVVASLAVAVGLTHIPLAAWPKGFTPPSDVHLDPTMLAFASGLGVITGILFGIGPALRIVRQDDKAAMQPGRAVTESRSHGRTRAALVTAEIALSMMLVAGALSVALHFLSLLRADPGADPHNSMVMSVDLPQARYPKGDSKRAFYRALMEKLATLPDVTAVGGGVDTPFSGSTANGGFNYEGQPAGSDDKTPFAEKHYITTGFFAAVGASIWQGRDFNHQDQPGTPPVAIINRTMAQKLWPGQSAIGKKLMLGDQTVANAGMTTSIVGVVADIQFASPGEPHAFQIYQPVDQATPPSLTFVVRTSGNSVSDPLALAGPARAAVASIDPQLAVTHITSLEVLSQDALAGRRTSTTVTSVLGVLALLLASIGVYGVMAYVVSRRKREFGIRIALGADRTRIARLLYSSVLRMSLAGVTLGIGLAYVARVWITSMLGAQGISGSAILFGGLLLVTIAILAASVPAHRAMSVQPMEALRNE
jgi:putative ABC transport system permease protein